MWQNKRSYDGKTKKKKKKKSKQASVADMGPKKS